MQLEGTDALQSGRLIATPRGPLLVADGEQVLVGCGAHCDWRADPGEMADEQALFWLVDGVLAVRDRGSDAGTTVQSTAAGSEPLSVDSQGVRLSDGEIITMGQVRFEVVPADADDLGALIDPSTGGLAKPPGPTVSVGTEHQWFQRVPFEGPITIGRDSDNDITLEEPLISREHARLLPLEGGAATLVDARSRTGTMVSGRSAEGSARLEIGDEFRIGPYILRLANGEVEVRDSRGDMVLEADRVGVEVPDKVILKPTSLALHRGEMTALVGPSGCGKSTLLKAMGALTQPTTGSVQLDGDPVAGRRDEIGYVPQSETVHEHLTTLEALRYAAILRLPADTEAGEIDRAVSKVLGEMNLGDHTQTRVKDLSGGQRRRVACAMELLGNGSFLLLDEPTSGLDPGLERQLMETFRALADHSRGVLVVTHATRSLELCDTVAVMGRDGIMLFVGSPEEALEHFGVETFDAIYDNLKAADVEPVEPRVRRRPARVQMAKRADRPFWRQATAIAGRYALNMFRDRGAVAVMVLQVGLIGGLIVLTYPASIFENATGGMKRVQFVFLLVTASIWFGLVGSCRELVKERTTFERERAAGLSPGAYLLAKASVMFAVVAGQTLLLTVGVLAFVHLYAPAVAYVEFSMVMLACAFSAVGVGLLASAFATGVEQASISLPPLLMPQLLLAGALVPIDDMPTIGKWLSTVIAARWAVAGAGSASEVMPRLPSGIRNPLFAQYGTFFDLDPLRAAGILVLFGLVALGACALRLRR